MDDAEQRFVVNQEEERRDIIGEVLTESKKVWQIGFPSMLARVSSFGMLVVTQLFIGHISDLDLAAYALVQIIGVRFVNGILLGMSSATETLCGQAFGARQYLMMGIYLQRSWIVDLVTATVLVPVFVFAAPIFRLLGENDEIAEAAGTIAIWFIPTAYSFVFSLTIQMYLQAQLKNMIVGWIFFVCFLLHLLLSWAFVDLLNFGIPGAMTALIVSNWCTVVAEMVYILGGWCPGTWGGFTTAAFKDLLPVVKLSVSSGIMLCLELWYNAVLVLIAGYMKDATVAVSAFSICLNICSWEFMICLGFLSAACVRVSNELGRGDASAAKFSIMVVLSTSVCLGVLFWILCLVFGDRIGDLFTSSEAIVESVSSLKVLLAFSVLLNSVQPVLTGVAIGAGWQGAVAVVNVCTYYVIGIPVGLLLGYVAHLEIKGIWIGMLLGVLVQTIVLGVITWRTNWEEQVIKATQRLDRWLMKPARDAEQSLIKSTNDD